MPVRYARMLSSEFAFFRGAAAIMASDLSYSQHTHLTVQLAATRTWPTSAATPHPIGPSSSTSTTSTRRCQGRSNGTSSGSSRVFAVAGRSRVSMNRPAPGSWPSSRPTGKASTTSRTCRAWMSGTRLTDEDIENATPGKGVQVLPQVLREDGGESAVEDQRSCVAQTHHDRGRRSHHVRQQSTVPGAI